MDDTAVAVVIIAGGTRPHLDECLLSLAESTLPPREILVVDNSPSGLGASFQAAFPKVNLVQPARRLTFAQAANLGMRMTIARGAMAVFLLNDDVTVHHGTLAVLAGAQESYGPGVFAPEIWPYERSNSRTRFAMDWTKRLAVRVPVAINGPVTPIDYAEGSAMFVSVAVPERIGSFDEAFGFYYEDADYSIRASEAGFPVLEVEGARVWHKGSVSAGRGLSPFKAYYQARNTLRFAVKHRKRAHVASIAAYHFAGFLVPALLSAAARTVLGSRAGARTLGALARGTWDLLTGSGGTYLPATLPDLTEEIARIRLPRAAG